MSCYGENPGSNRRGPAVGVLVGSASDLEKIKPVCDTLSEFGISYEVAVISAHRTPELLQAYAETVPQRGVQVLIAAAGLSAALPGALAALVEVPVIGLPLSVGALHGTDALFSIAQMPPGVPVASVGIDAARNAALLAVRILGLGDPDISRKLREYRMRMADDAVKRAEAARAMGFPCWEPTSQ